MIRLTPLFVILVVLVACDSREAGPTRPSSLAAALPATPVITVGTEFRDTFGGTPLTYELTAPAYGRLVVRLRWDASAHNARLMLTLGDVRFPLGNVQFRGSAPNWSPVVGEVAVSAGQKYRLRIEEGVAPWDYGFDDPFVLTTAIE